jgi:hypothetical protein
MIQISRIGEDFGWVAPGAKRRREGYLASFARGNTRLRVLTAYSVFSE